jgi:hypothetical protein
MDRTRIRAWQVHSAAFLIFGVLAIVIDLSQGAEDGVVTFLGLEWAHIIVLIWTPIVATHVLLTWPFTSRGASGTRRPRPDL